MSSSGLFPSRPLWPLTPLALACLIVSGETLGADGRPSELPSQVITANPLGNESPATPSSVLEGDELTLRQKGSLGETLNGLPGVSSTYFGPGASRPVIRGMDGDRIRLLRNGVGALDASSLSYDHAVPEDPNSVERLEVVRGPAALLYGGNAIGGVVNSFDNRIPSEPVDGIHGSGELRYGGADTTRSRSGALEAGDGNFALHVDAASREFNDVRIPGYAHSSRQRQIDGDTGKHRVQNSDGRQDGGAVGGSYHWEHGYAGLSYSGYDSNYGSPAEDDVRLKMQLRDRLDLSFGARLEHTRVDPDAKGNERFAENDGSQSFTTGSLSTGAVYKLTPIWSLAATLSYTERAPTFYELYANGPHAATGTYEVGDADADKEKAVSTDLALRFDNGVHKGSVGVFYSRFSNYISLLASGRHRNEEGEVVAAGDDEALPEYLYSGVRADFYGVEAQDRIHLLESPYGNFDLELSGDYTRAKNKDTGEPLPRIAPLRLNTALIWELQQWQARVDVEHAASQHRVPEEELSTDGYTTLGASLGYNFDLGESRWLAFVKGTNLTNQTVRYASSILRDRVPAAGRGIEAGVKVAF